MKNYAVILAAGKGTRMKTEIPKCAYPLMKKPMIKYIVEALDNSYEIDESILVVGHKKEVFEEMLGNKVKYAFQSLQKGTGHAVKVALPLLDDEEGNVLITCGDMPLIDEGIIKSIFDFHNQNSNDITVISTYVYGENTYGKIVRDNKGKFVKIVEHKECSLEQKTNPEINTGVYLVKTKVLKDCLNEIQVENEKECYLTDIIEVGNKKGYKIEAFASSSSMKFTGINDLYTLSVVEAYIRKEINKKHMLNGVHIITPDTVIISSEVEIEPGAIIYPNTFLTGKTHIGKNCIIGPNTEIENSIVEEGTSVIHSLVKDSKIGANTTIGPFTHIRNNTSLGDNMRVGNFVEIKNSIIDNGTKVSHLTYIGDTTCGKNVNWGCGTVTVNYDGKYKNRTTVGDDCFIGCNTNLIAPVSVGNNAFIAAGSTITDDVPAEAFSIARERQVTKEDYATRFPYYKKVHGEEK